MMKRTTGAVAALALAGVMITWSPAAAQKPGCVVSDIIDNTPSAGLKYAADRAAPDTKRTLSAEQRKAASEAASKAVSQARAEALKKYPKSTSTGGLLSIFSPSDSTKLSKIDHKRISEARAIESRNLTAVLSQQSVSCAELREIVAADRPATPPAPGAAASPR